MTPPRWANDDDELLAELTSALSHQEPAGVDDDVVERMRRAAKSAFTWRTVDQELERLTMSTDSELEAAAHVRGAGDPTLRVVAFEGQSLTLELEIGSAAIIGQAFPAPTGPITLITPNGVSMQTHADDVGCFTFDRPAEGPFRLRCDSAETVVVTEWISLL